MYDKKMQVAIEQFVQRRLTDYGMKSNSILQVAHQAFEDSLETFEHSLSKEQRKHIRKLENTYASANGETVNFYYRAGFSDAIEFLLSFRGEENEISG